MGVDQYYPYIKETLKYNPIEVYPNANDSFIVDAKALMYKKASSVPIDCENIAQAIADKIINQFSKFPNVLFVNDGIEKIPQMKCSTNEKRKRQKIKNQAKADEEKEKLTMLKDKKRKRDEEENELTQEQKETRLIIEDLSFALKEEAVEKRLRNARGVSSDLSFKVLEILTQYGFKTIQCEGEADPVIVELSSQYTYIIGDDSDFLISGATNLLRGFGTSTNLLYNSKDILALTPFTQEQVKQLACIAGCDYTDGLQGVGIKTADKLFRKYKNFDKFCQNTTKYYPCENFKEIILKGVELYSRKESFIIQNNSS